MSTSRLPPQAVVDAFLADTVRVARRIEVFEFDGVTPWRRDLWPDMLESGSVSLDYSRDERRTFELGLMNLDGEINPGTDNLWYDKIFKIFYGVHLDQRDRDMRVIIVEEYSAPGQAGHLRAALNAAGIKKVHVNPLAETLADVEKFDIVVAISDRVFQKLPLLHEAAAAGKSVVTFSNKAGKNELPHLIETDAGTVTTFNKFFYKDTDTSAQDLDAGWDGWALQGAKQSKKFTTLSHGTIGLAKVDNTGGPVSSGWAAVALPMPSGSKWVHLSQAEFQPDVFLEDESYNGFTDFLGVALGWSYGYQPMRYWETQIGEFLIDSISDDGEGGGVIKVSGRDYTKRCMSSRLDKATTFDHRQTIGEVITALASNALIRKIEISIETESLGKDMTWERDTSRWDIIKEIAQSKSMQVFFDSHGVLRLIPMNDPSNTPPVLILSTGARGNLISRGVKTSDGELFNRVTVVGESSDTTARLVYGEAANRDHLSPSRIERIGERTKSISSPLVTSEQEAVELAQKMLSVSTLEEFQMDFSSIMLPWIEPGEIIEMGESGDRVWGPSRYLLTSLVLPLDLSPMSGNGKRVTIVA